MAGRRTAGRCPEADEWLRCSLSPAYWMERHGWIYDATGRAWTRFRPWPAQVRVAELLQRERLSVILKARQLGLSWLCVGFGLWLMLFHPAATVLFFSRRDDEATHLLGYRLRGMYDRLPAWMQNTEMAADSKHELRLSNGSTALAFPTTGGRSYTASLAVVDEADHTANLDALLDAVKPTIDAGGRLVLVSTADKGQPGSPFKRIYLAAKAGENGYRAIFLPWWARPGRTARWYEQQKADVLARSGSLDSLHQEYPASDVEALAGRASDRRYAPGWLARADATAEAAAGAGPALPGLAAWERPVPGRWYVIGADPAEGNPQSDESAACVCDAVTGDQVAVLAGRFEPAVFAAHLAALSDRYAAGVLVERNNHGHAVLLWLAGQGFDRVLRGLDGRPGWLSSGKGKPLMVDAAADVLRDGRPQVRDRETLRQLMEVRGATLAAPGGDHDDRAVAWALCQAAARYCEPASVESRVIAPAPVVSEAETGGW